MLSNLQLKNFKRHEALDLVFEEELNTLTGENASGKSSVLKAILYSLFGVAAAGVKDHIWKWGAEGKRSVALAITLPEYGRVAVTRTVTGATILTEDGRVLASGQTAVTKFIEDALGMAVKDLRTLCYSPQGETQGLLSMGPAVLQQKVESLSRADVVDNVLTKIGSDIAKYDGKLEGLLVDLDLEELGRRLVDVEGFIYYKKEELTDTHGTETHLQRSKTSLVLRVRTAQDELTKGN
jgi:DNA repair exonuclease SbcCD ATPase subunit